MKLKHIIQDPIEPKAQYYCRDHFVDVDTGYRYILVRRQTEQGFVMDILCASDITERLERPDMHNSNMKRDFMNAYHRLALLGEKYQEHD
jgi:hypothetical protein